MAAPESRKPEGELDPCDVAVVRWSRWLRGQHLWFGIVTGAVVGAAVWVLAGRPRLPLVYVYGQYSYVEHGYKWEARLLSIPLPVVSVLYYADKK